MSDGYGVNRFFLGSGKNLCGTGELMNAARFPTGN